MSDSDDTDILLLIPPDYFLNAAQEKLQLEERTQRQQKQFQKHLDAFEKRQLKKPYYRQRMETNEREHQQQQQQQPNSIAPTTAAYKFLEPNKKAELNFINSRLQTIEALDEKAVENENFAMPSDISTISTNTVRSQVRQQSKCVGQARMRNSALLVHSTPKGRSTTTTTSRERLNDDNVDDVNVGDYDRNGDVDGVGVLLEIDNFLEDHRYNKQLNIDWQRHSDEFQTKKSQEKSGGCGGGVDAALDELQAKSLPGFFGNRSQQQQPPSSFKYDRAAIVLPTPAINSMRDPQNLISLSEIWSKSGQHTAIHADTNVHSNMHGSAGASTSMSLREEQLRRQHLEKMVQSLQSNLLEYQQRISVAIEVDKQKDAILRSNQTEHGIMENEIFRLRETLGKFEHDQRELQMQKDTLQRDLAQAVSLAAKFEEKNEKLESELGAASKKTNDCLAGYKAQIEDLEYKLHGYKRSEELALDENSKLKDKLARAEHQIDKLKQRCDELEKDNNTLKHQKEMLQDFHSKLKSRSDGLETQRKSLQESLAQLTESEMQLKRKLETQQKTLKMHYQQQLENVVANKLKEFQAQLDKTEETLKAEARERERLIAERAVKQLELINDKNELEHNLLQEKHNEEVELYRIQLANASKKIEELEMKLQTYKSKRADLAEKLHDVMETQWQKALEILTSPSLRAKSNASSTTSSQIENSPLSNDCGDNEAARADHHLHQQQQQQSMTHFETPKMNKFQRKSSSNNLKQNNLNVVANDVNNATSAPRKSNEIEPVDRLQAYIELLLSKSPSDVDKLDEILALTRKSKAAAGNAERTNKRNSINNNHKPPWKA